MTRRKLALGALVAFLMPAMYMAASAHAAEGLNSQEAAIFGGG